MGVKCLELKMYCLKLIGQETEIYCKKLRIINTGIGTKNNVTAELETKWKTIMT